MTEHGWARGMALLVANLKAPDHTPDMARLRGETYRRMLGQLSDDDWFFAVDEAIREPGGWFPGVGDLLNYASRAPHLPVTALPGEPALSAEERRQNAEHGMRLLREVEREVNRHLPPAPRVVAPEEPYLAVVSDERLDTLRKQAAEILTAPGPRPEAPKDSR